jgi:deoxyribose-phosphate aldolase
VHRGRVTPAEVLALLELRLYRGHGEEPPSTAAVVLGCAVAAEWDVGAVITRPDHVRAASTTLAHRGPVVVTGLRLDPSDPRPLLAEARDLIRSGADDLALVAPGPRIEGDLAGLVEEATEVARFASGVGARVRVVVDTEGLARRVLLDACERLAQTGVWLVQGGLWRSALPSFADVKAMRRAVPDHVLLKWTAPMTRVDTLLSCVAAGVDRFSVDDVPGFMAHTLAHAELGPLVVPDPA